MIAGGLASFRYRNVSAADGGPVQDLSVSPFSFRGERWFQAAAKLRPGLIRRRPLELYSEVDGFGASFSPVIARHMAISEALERWAYHAIMDTPSVGVLGIEIDPTTSGMAAFPGFTADQAQRRAGLEAIERYCLMAWWEGYLPAQLIATDWPGVGAIVIDSPMGAFPCICYRKTDIGYAIGYSAAVTISSACERAMLEMDRHERVVSLWNDRHGRRDKPGLFLERRALFFASPDGGELLLQRAHIKPWKAPPKPRKVVDAEISGPWSRYATVWRTLYDPPSRTFLDPTRDDYLFW